MSSSPVIALRGVRVHNLRGIDVDIPLGKITAITGVCGAGKSSLAFETLYAEAQRRYLQSFSVRARQSLERLDKPDADSIGDLPAAIAVAPARHAPEATVGSITELSDWLALCFVHAGVSHCPRCGAPARAHSAADVADAVAALPAGAPFSIAFPSRPEPGEASAWASALVEEGFIRAQVGEAVVRLGEQPLPADENQQIWIIVDRLKAGGVAPDRLADSVETAFRRGDDRLALLTDGGAAPFDRRLRCQKCDLELPTPQPRLFNRRDALAACPVCHAAGFQPAPTATCIACTGSGWSETARSVRLAGKTIADAGAVPLADLGELLERVPPGPLLAPILAELRRRLKLIVDGAVGHLHLDRAAETLNAREAQRLRLCAALAANLVGALYVLDEPLAGLHARDIPATLDLLRQLREAGNTVVVVEHHAALIRRADWVIDLGPGAAEEGGRVVYQGPPSGLGDPADSATGAFLTGRERIDPPDKHRTPTGWLRLSGARLHNLQDLTVEFPLGVLCAVTGVSGAGKSSLVEHTLYPLLAQHQHKKGVAAPPPGASLAGASNVADVALIKQEPLARSARSNPATFVKVFDEVRTLFAETTEAKIRNFGVGHFSFNQPGGRCETCEGQGSLAVDMQFLADVAMTCPECQGARYKKEILAIKVRSLSIAEVLELSVREAFRFFRAQRSVQHKLKRLIDVGLEHVRLGQPIDTLSGGEAQRLRLAGHFAASRKPRCLFILIEPAAGLHPADVAQLLASFDGLLATGHSLVVVEHNLDVIRSADYVIEVGPGAGRDGGRVVVAGPPERPV